MTDSEKVKCPKCKSDQISAMRKGFSGGKAVAGALVTGGIGVLAGTHGSNNMQIGCLNCGHKWDPKKEFRTQKLNEHNNVKRDVRRYYRQGNYEKATEVYLRSKMFNSSIPDIHAAYRSYKAEDITAVVLNLIVFGGIIWLIYAIFY